MTRGAKSEVGDVRISPNGYHYTRTEEKWELTGRLVAGVARGRALEPNERVRYKDGNRLNNDPDNLEVYVAKEGSTARKKARLESRIAELQAQLEELESDDQDS